MKNSYIKRLARRIKLIRKAMPMPVVAPSVDELKKVMNAIRNALGLEKTQKPIWANYITVQEGIHSKYHYFVVFQDGDEFKAVNANGRIGVTYRVFEIGTFDSEAEATRAAEKKMNKKISEGYKPTVTVL